MSARCPRCRDCSTSRHSSYQRKLSDLPIQGQPVTIVLRVGRWRCRNPTCEQAIFTERLRELAAPYAQGTLRFTEIIRLLGHRAGGRPGQHLAGRLGLATSKDTILRHLTRDVGRHQPTEPLRVVGIDEWAWRKGHRFGTIVIDLERRAVADILPDRSTTMTATWLRQHPHIELIARDRDGVYGDAARQGTSDAGQVADRFHLLQNLRFAIETQLKGLERPFRAAMPGFIEDRMVAGTSLLPGETLRSPLAMRPRLSDTSHLQSVFERVRAMYDTGTSVASIVRQLRLGRKMVDKWVRLKAIPTRNRMRPTSSTPAGFQEYLKQRWSAGCTQARVLLNEVRAMGYTGCYSQLAAFLSPWRERDEVIRSEKSIDVSGPPPSRAAMPRDPYSGHTMSPIVAAALCLKPRRLLTSGQRAKVDVLNFAVCDEPRVVCGFRVMSPGIPTNCRPGFRDEVAHRSDLGSPTIPT